MGTSTTYPNGQTLVSSALTPDAINKVIQVLTCGMLGIVPADYSQVRVDWQLQGQPFQDATMDRCYVSCVTIDEPYTKVRNLTVDGSLTPQPNATQTWTYTRAWTVSWHFYGPTSTDDARMVHSGMFMDWADDQLAVSNLFPVTDFKEPVRQPENVNAQWWDHSFFEVTMYENVTETIQPGVVVSVEINLNDESGQVADFTVNAV